MLSGYAIKTCGRGELITASGFSSLPSWVDNTVTGLELIMQGRVDNKKSRSVGRDNKVLQ